MDQKEINDFLDSFKKLAELYIIDKFDDLRQNVEDFKLIYEDEYETTMKTIERIKDHVNKTLDEVNEMLTIWYKHKVLNRKYRFEPRSDVKDKLENIFKKEYERFINRISSDFEYRLIFCDSLDHWEVKIYNLEQIFDDFINEKVEKTTQSFMKKLRSITGVDEVEKRS